MSLLEAVIGALLVSFVGTRLALILARRRQVMAIPNKRSSHTLPTPSGGGLGICLALAIALPFGLLGGPDGARWWVVLPIIAVGWVGWRDDARPLAARWKMLTLTASAAGLLSIAHLQVLVLPYLGAMELGLLALPLSLFWLAGFTNAFNFMDGINGIASVTAIISGAAFALAGIDSSDRLLAVMGAVTAAGAAGFLPWNFPTARIFMGDAGSLPLGLILSFCALRAESTSALPFVASVLLLGPFVFDSTFTIVHRAMRGERLWQAHREHLYQRLARRIGSHPPVTALYAVLSIITAALALSYNHASELGRMLCLVLPLVAMVLFAALVVSIEGRGE